MLSGATFLIFVIVFVNFVTSQNGNPKHDGSLQEMIDYVKRFGSNNNVPSSSLFKEPVENSNPEEDQFRRQLFNEFLIHYEQIIKEEKTKHESTTTSASTITTGSPHEVEIPIVPTGNKKLAIRRKLNHVNSALPNTITTTPRKRRIHPRRKNNNTGATSATHIIPSTTPLSIILNRGTIFGHESFIELTAPTLPLRQISVDKPTQTTSGPVLHQTANAYQTTPLSQIATNFIPHHVVPQNHIVKATPSPPIAKEESVYQESATESTTSYPRQQYVAVPFQATDITVPQHSPAQAPLIAEEYLPDHTLLTIESTTYLPLLKQDYVSMKFPAIISPEPHRVPLFQPTPAHQILHEQPIAPSDKKPILPTDEVSEALTAYNTEPKFDEKEFRRQAESAKYQFASSIDDGINGNLHLREEVRDGLAVKGKYSYSDGYYKRTVHYEADDKGYRVVREEVELLTGPQTNPDGHAKVSSYISGNTLNYEITKDDIKKGDERIAITQK